MPDTVPATTRCRRRSIPNIDTDRLTRRLAYIRTNQLALAQDQWNFQKNTYLPKAMAQADEQIKLNTALTANALKDSELYRGLAKDSFDQAKKID